jgi:hypothetical protein
MNSMISLLLRLWLVLSLVPISGCYKNGKPTAPVVVTVRESCIRQKAPTIDSTIDCLDQASRADTIQAGFDCLARAIEIRDLWIAQQIAKCGVK